LRAKQKYSVYEAAPDVVCPVFNWTEEEIGRELRSIGKKLIDAVCVMAGKANLKIIIFLIN